MTAGWFAVLSCQINRFTLADWNASLVPTDYLVQSLWGVTVKWTRFLPCLLKTCLEMMLTSHCLLWPTSKFLWYACLKIDHGLRFVHFCLWQYFYVFHLPHPSGSNWKTRFYFYSKNSKLSICSTNSMDHLKGWFFGLYGPLTLERPWRTFWLFWVFYLQ